MLKVLCNEHLRDVYKFAKRTGQLDSLVENIQYLHHWGESWSRVRPGVSDAAQEEWARYSSSQTPEWTNLVFKRGKDLRHYTAQLRKDFAPYSFICDIMDTKTGKHSYTIGLIYSGPLYDGEGGVNTDANTFSVNLTPHQGWSCHT